MANKPETKKISRSEFQNFRERRICFEISSNVTSAFSRFGTNNVSKTRERQQPIHRLVKYCTRLCQIAAKLPTKNFSFVLRMAKKFSLPGAHRFPPRCASHPARNDVPCQRNDLSHRPNKQNPQPPSVHGGNSAGLQKRYANFRERPSANNIQRLHH